MSDPLEILRTGRDATPGPWTVYPDAGACYVLSGDEHVATCGIKPDAQDADDARHIATWSPETTREVVALLAEIDSTLRPMVCDVAPDDWCGRLDALLARVRERMGE